MGTDNSPTQDSGSTFSGIRIGGNILQMKCPRGHEWTQEVHGEVSPLHLTIHSATGTYSSKPLCPQCLIDLLNEKASAEIISSMPKYPGT